MNSLKRFLPVVLTAVLCVLHAADLDLQKEYKHEIALYRISPDQVRSLRRDPDGTPVSEPQLKVAVRNFYDWLYPLDPVFLKRIKFKTVIFKDTVYDRDGKAFQMLPAEDDLFVDADLDEKQFYTNLFYRQLPAIPRIYLEHWNKLNPDGFSYENTRGSISAQTKKKLEAVLLDWDKYFVSRTGLYSTEMDMAQTFTYMITRGPDATAFVKKNSPDVQKKFDMIVDILESIKAVERGYMQTLLADDLSQLKTFVPYALSVRLEREYSGIWSASKTGGDQTGPGSRIGDPVEVAGRKIIPLILALETKNSRLFSVLMQNKVDPNVASEKKVSALMLAIANNDPEQVEALLEAGANVTQEAARAGTASGVNAEIVRILKSYLPGVRPSDTAERKKPDRASGGAGSRESAGGSLNKRLNEAKFNHLELEEVELTKVLSLIQAKSKEYDPTGEGIRISFPQKYAGSSFTIVADQVSLYDILRLISRKFELEMRIEEPNRVIISGSNAKQPETGKKNGSAKKEK